MESLKVYIECDNLTPGEVMGVGNPIPPTETKEGSGDVFVSPKKKKKSRKPLSRTVEESILDTPDKTKLVSHILEEVCGEYWDLKTNTITWDEQEKALHIKPKTSSSVHYARCSFTYKFLKETGINHLVFHDCLFDLGNGADLEGLTITLVGTPGVAASNYITAKRLTDVRFEGFKNENITIYGDRDLYLKRVTIPDCTALILKATTVTWDPSCQIDTYTLFYDLSHGTMTKLLSGMFLRDVVYKQRVNPDPNSLKKQTDIIFNSLSIPKKVRIGNLAISYNFDVLILVKKLSQIRKSYTGFIDCPDVPITPLYHSGDWVLNCIKDNREIWKNDLNIFD